MKKVLIVEDEAVIREAYTILLEAHGYDVASAANGEEALQKCKDGAFDAILLDLMMPVIDGIGFLERANLRASAPKTKVILLSNLSSGQEVIKAKELGACRHEVKSDLAPSDVIAVLHEEIGS